MKGYSGAVLLIVLVLTTNGGMYMALSAQQCIPGKARLVNGTRINEGLLEVCTENSTWSTICYNHFSCNERKVACRQVGYDEYHGFYGTSNRQGKKPKLGYYSCAGTENSLSDCNKRPGFTVSIHCTTTFIVGLKCSKKPNENCPTQNAIRLFGGTKKSEGQLQICRNKKWRDVCDGSSDSQALGYVACRELGYSGNWVSTSHSRHFYNATTVPFAYTTLRCNRNYLKTSYCSIYSENICYTCSGQVVITCEIEKTNCKERDLRLVGGPSALEGWVEICVDGLWGRVTGKVEGNAKDLICSALGFNETGAVVIDGYAARRTYKSASNSPSLVKYINCCDRDKTFQTCDIHYTKVTDITLRGQDYALRCIDGCTHRQMRLVGGSSKHEGVVEMCISGTWQTVGVNQWDDTDANVVCQHLYPGQKYAYAVATNSSEFQASTRQVYYDYFRCNGAESNVNYCSKRYALGSYTPEVTAAVNCHPVCNC